MPRRDITMSDDEVQDFLAGSSTVQVATNGPDGWPHVAPMWFVLDDGLVVFRSFTKSQKIVNLRRDRRLTVLVESGEAYSELRGVMIKGDAELVDDPDLVLGMYGALAARYPMVGDEPRELTPDELHAAFGSHAAKNTGVIVHPVRTVTWDHTKLGGTY